MCVTWLIDTCDMTHPFVKYRWHDLYLCVTWCVIRETSRMNKDTTNIFILYSYLLHDSFVRVASLNHNCDMPHVWHDVLIHVTWLVHVWMNHSRVWLDSCFCVTWCVIFETWFIVYDSFVRVASLNHNCDMQYVWHGPGIGRVTNSVDQIIIFRLWGGFD